MSDFQIPYSTTSTSNPKRIANAVGLIRSSTVPSHQENFKVSKSSSLSKDNTAFIDHLTANSITAGPDPGGWIAQVGRIGIGWVNANPIVGQGIAVDKIDNNIFATNIASLVCRNGSLTSRWCLRRFRCRSLGRCLGG